MARWFITPPAPPAPSGFTLVMDELSDGDAGGALPDNYFFVYYAIDDGTLANTSMPVLATFNNQWVIVLRPSEGEPSLSYNGYVNVRSAGDPTAITTPSSNATTPTLVVGYQRNTSTGEGFNQEESPQFQYEFSLGSGSGGTVAFSIYNADPANHTIDVSDRAGTYNMLVAFYLEFN